MKTRSLVLPGVTFKVNTGIIWNLIPNNSSIFVYMIEREGNQELIRLGKTFKSVAVTGCRQSGKTTMVKYCFPSKPYVSLENPDTRSYAISDPRGFLAGFPEGAILDEVQRTPELFSYLQEILDSSREKGLFILTGSNNFLLQQSISQSLAGRIGYYNLQPFSISELSNAGLLSPDDNHLMLNGFYPPIYDQKIAPADWMPNYVRTYIERDVRQIKNISDLLVFERFMKLLAGRCGQEFNASSLSVESGVDVKTIQSWVGILEASYLIFLLRPYHKNFNKTIVKRPKIYFHDTGLVCWLIGIQAASQLDIHPLRGAIFENMVVSEMYKVRSHHGRAINLFYWRDKTGHEVDLIVDEMPDPKPIEIKSGQTIQPAFFRNLEYWNKISGNMGATILYGGTGIQNRSNGIHVLPWRNIAEGNL